MSYFTENCIDVKSLVIIVSFVASTFNLYSQTTSGTIVFDEKKFDFGNIEEKDGIVSHTFYFRNEGKTPVVIEDIVTGCSCTGHRWSKEPVKPGQKGQITITYDPRYRGGFFSKEIDILSNNHKRLDRVWIKGNVISYVHPVEEDYPYDFGEGLYLNLKVLAFGKITPGQYKQIKLRYANDTNNPVALDFIIDANDGCLFFDNPGQLLPKQRGEVIFTYMMPKVYTGEISVNVYPVVNGKKLRQPLAVKVSGTL